MEVLRTRRRHMMVFTAVAVFASAGIAYAQVPTAHDIAERLVADQAAGARDDLHRGAGDEAPERRPIFGEPSFGRYSSGFETKITCCQQSPHIRACLSTTDYFCEA